MAVTYQTSNTAYPYNTPSGTISVSSYTGAGVTLTTGAGVGGSNGISNATFSYVNPSSNFYSSNNKTIMTIPHGEEKMVLEKEATLEVKGNVVINGVDLEERLNTIEKVLQIPQRDVIMESKYPKLKQLYEQYMHELDKYTTWDKVKGNTNDSST
jgi:hypothetical protein